jgi:hypothetical protein
MSAAPLLPQAFWFRLAIPCARIDDLPRKAPTLRLELPDSCRVPQTARLDGREPWAEVRVAWNPRGLAVELIATADLVGLFRDDKPEGSYGFQLWVDTRDTRDVARATRFCHRFDGTLRKTSGKTRQLALDVVQKPIARAVADAPIADQDAIRSSIDLTRTGWKAAVFLSTEAFHGLDSETNRRLGFCYRVADPDLPDEVLGVGREFPIGENPSLWSTLELREPK